MRQILKLMLAITAAALVAEPGAAQPDCAPGWIPGFASTESYGRSAPITTFDFDGSGPLPEVLVVRQHSGIATSDTQPRIATWDGVRWGQLGDRFSGSVLTLGVHDARLVAGGQFAACGSTTLNGVAIFDGNAWVPLGTGLTSGGGEVRSVTSFNGELYAGGTFVGGLRRWTGSTWSAVPGWIGAHIDRLGVFNGELILASRSDLGGYPAVRWNGSSWMAFPGLGRSQENVAVALHSEPDRLYLAGPCTIGGLSKRLLSWDGAGLAALPDWPLTGRSVLGFARLDQDLVAFGTPGPFGRASGIERLTGATWTPVAPSSPSSGTVVAATTFHGFLLVAGASGSLQYFDPASPNYLFDSMPADGWTFGPFGLAKYDGQTVITGNFRYLGSASTGPLTRWDGRHFARFPFPYGANEIGRCFADGDDLIVFGNYTDSAGPLARFHNGTWSRETVPSTGVSFEFTASGRWMAKHVVVGFHRDYSQTPTRLTGRVFVNYASGWERLGEDLLGSIWAVEAFENDLYVAGSFAESTSGRPLASIARWDGAQWQAVGGGIGGTCNALRVVDGRLFAGGLINSAGGVVVHNVAAWDGAEWSHVGDGGIGTVHSLPDLGDSLYVACSSNSIEDDGVFRLTNSSWIRVAAPFNLIPSGPIAYGNEMIALGNVFTDSLVSTGTVRFSESGLPGIARDPRPARPCRSGIASFYLNHSGPGPFTYRWRRNGQLLSDGLTPSGSTILGAASHGITISNSALGDVGMYDCIVSNACGEVVSAPALLALCIADFNCSGAVAVQDIFDYLAAFFTQSPSADIDGAGGVSVQDLFEFLVAYFQGC